MEGKKRVDVGKLEEKEGKKGRREEEMIEEKKETLKVLVIAVLAEQVWNEEIEAVDLFDHTDCVLH